MKRYLSTIAFVFLSFLCLAQNEPPAWTKKTPKPKLFNKTFEYKVITVCDVEKQDEAHKKAMQEVCIAISNSIKRMTWETYIKDGQVYFKPREGQAVRWPNQRVCEWHNPINKTEWKFLYQIADMNHTDNYRFETFQDCYKTNRKIYWRAGVESLVPGLGQMVDKKSYWKGAGFFVGTAACLTIGLIANNDYQYWDNKANKTLPGTKHDEYIDAANQCRVTSVCFLGAAALCYVANICDALFAPPKYNVTTYINNESAYLSLNVKF